MPSARRIWNAVSLLLTVQRRSGFLHVYLGVALVTVLMVRLVFPSDLHAVLVPLVMLGEYGSMGVFMVAAHRYLERIEGSAAALVVTPLSHREHVVAMILAPALVATAAGILVQGGILGVDGRLFWLAAPLFSAAALAGAIGIVLSSRYDEFTRFLMGSIPLITFLSLPYLSFFELVPRFTFVWLPWDAALFSFENVARSTPDAFTFAWRLASLAGFTLATFVWAERSYHRRMTTFAEAA